MSVINDLKHDFENDFFTALPYRLHSDFGFPIINASDIGEMLLYLSRFIIDDEDDGCDRYISRRDMAYCVINLVIAEMKYAIYCGRASVNGGCFMLNEHGLKIKDLRRFAQKLKEADEYGEFLDFTKDIDEIEDMDFSKCKMHFDLLEHIPIYNPELIMHMLYFMHSIASEDELKEYDRLNIREYTAEGLKQRVGKNNSSVYCHCFLDVASEHEKRGMHFAMEGLKAAEEPKDVALKISDQDMYLGRWIVGEPLLPCTTYKLMCDYSFRAHFLEEIEYNESNVVDSADMEREDFAEIIPRAIAGDEEAQYELGIKYINFSSATIHRNKAKYWLRCSAERGLSRAQISYGALLYQDGEFAEAIEWYKRAAEDGNSEAQYRVGIAYADGQGVTADANEARKWLKLAAKQDHFLAKIRLENLK